MGNSKKKKDLVSSVAGIGAYIIAFLVVSAIVAGFFKQNDTNPSPEALRNTAKNNFISTCIQSAQNKGYSDAQLQNYCSCGEAALYNKYGPKLYEPEMEKNLQANGYSQVDTDLTASKCNNYLGI